MEIPRFNLLRMADYRLAVSEGTEAGEEFAHLRQDFGRLLAPLVHDLLRSPEGGIDLSKIPAKDFSEFKSFIAAQAGLNDGVSFSFRQWSTTPYRKLLSDERFAPLFKLLYQQVNSQESVGLSVSEAEGLLQELQAELIAVDAEKFARDFMSSPEGRDRLSALLKDSKTLSIDLRSDLIKGIAHTAQSQGLLSDMESFQVSQVSALGLWDYFNLFTQDLDAAAKGALSLLGSAEYEEKSLAENSSELSARLTLEGKSQEIDPGKIQRMKALAEEKEPEPDPVSQAEAALAQAWLMAADMKRWDGALLGSDTDELRSTLLSRCEALLQEARQVKTERDFESFNEEIQRLFEETISLPSHEIIPIEVFQKMTAKARVPLDHLKRLSDLWKHSMDMGEAIVLGEIEVKSRSQDVQKMIRGLEQAKHELWYGYKQHKTLSRAGSRIANLLDSGDIQDIRRANREINQMIYRLSQAESEADLQEVVDQLFDSLKEKGVLHQALSAAEMDLSEQGIGLAQTMAVIYALGMATRGLSALGQAGIALARSTGVLRAAEGSAAVVESATVLAQTAQALETATMAERMANGFKLGAQITTAENALAVATNEVRQGPDTLEAWAKDASATGLSMTLTGMLPVSPGVATDPLKNLLARYSWSSARGAKFLAMDAGTEIVEESIDQYSRQAFDGDLTALSTSQLREIAAISLAGGWAKAGEAAEIVKGEHKVSKLSPAQEKSRSGLLTHPLLSPLWTFMGAGGPGGGDGSGKRASEPSVNASLVRKSVDRHWQGRFFLRRAVQGAEDIKTRSSKGTMLSSLALHLGEAGMEKLARAKMLEAGRIVERMGRGELYQEAQYGFAVNMAQLGAILKDRSLLSEAVKAIQSADKIGEPDEYRGRARARLGVAEKMAKFGMLSEARVLFAEADRLMVGEVDRFWIQGEIALTAAKLGMLSEVKSFCDMAAGSFKSLARMDANWERTRRQYEILARMTDLAVILRDRDFFDDSALLVDGFDDRERSKAQAMIAAKTAELAVALQDQALLFKAVGSLEEIWAFLWNHTDELKKIARHVAELGVALQDRGLLDEAAKMADWIPEDRRRQRSEAQLQVVKEMAKYAGISHDRGLLARAVQEVDRIGIENQEDATNAKLEIAASMARLGMFSEAETQFVQMAEIEKKKKTLTLIVDLLLEQCLLKMAEVAKDLLKESESLAEPLGGFQGEDFKRELSLLSARAPFYFAPRTASLFGRGGIFATESPLSQELALLGIGRTVLSEEDSSRFRRETMRELRKTEEARSFRVLTTALQAFGGPVSAQALLEAAREMRENLRDPRFPQLISQLVKTKNPKAFNLATQLIGEEGFPHRLWLVEKLEAAGHLEPGIFSYLKERRSEGVPIDRWLLGVVRELGITPGLTAMKFLLERDFVDSAGQELKTPEEVIAFLQSRKSEMEKGKGRFERLESLANDSQELTLHYLLFGGRTRFALVDKYLVEQFQEMLQVIHRDLGPIHPGVMFEFEQALSRRHEPEETQAILRRLHEGKWPLSERSYARELRIDVSSEKILEGLKERFRSIFSEDQLGILVEATLAPQLLTAAERSDPATRALVEELESAAGLGELAAKIVPLIEKVPDLARRIQERRASLEAKLPLSENAPIDPAAFQTKVRKTIRGELIQALRNKRGQETDSTKKERYAQEISRIEKAAPEEVVVAWLESLLKLNGKEVKIPHAAEWASHLREVFEGLESLGKVGTGKQERRVTLRYLDKEADLMESLRFADAAQCCFNSGSGHFDKPKTYLTRIWKDPLSLVFLLEDNVAGARERQATGFVFGSLGTKEGEPIVLLNGVYLQGKTNEATLAILNAIEQDFSRPLGATHQLVAATYGGRTQFDPAYLHAAGEGEVYTNESIGVKRLRALTDLKTGEPETKIYDDIDLGLNREETTLGHVWWKKLH